MLMLRIMIVTALTMQAANLFVLAPMYICGKFGAINPAVVVLDVVLALLFPLWIKQAKRDWWIFS